MPSLSDSITIRGNHIKNRIVMLPMVPFSLAGEDGDAYGEAHVAHYRARAEGGAGMIIVQATSVFGAASSTEDWTPGCMHSLRRIVDACRECGATVLMQLACEDLDVNSLFGRQLSAMQAEMLRASVHAAGMGFHGVEFHFAHGFTLCKFLDAETNKRRDAFGGSPENRARILTDILPDVRKETPDAFIVAVRMGADQPGEQDGLDAARVFAEAGVDLFDISYGMRPPAENPPADFPAGPGPYSGWRVRQRVGQPVIAVGDIRDGRTAAAVVEGGYADFAGIGRGMLADPDFARHVLEGRPVRACLGCGECAWFTDHSQCRGGRLAAPEEGHLIFGRSFSAQRG